MHEKGAGNRHNRFYPFLLRPLLQVKVYMMLGYPEGDVGLAMCASKTATAVKEKGRKHRKRVYVATGGGAGDMP